MKKIILFLFALILFASPTFAASYYGCASAAINADSTFCTTPTGSCAGDDPVTAATALAGTHTLYANGCTITVPEELVMTAAKLSNKDDGTAMVDGGQFTVTTTGWTQTTTHVTAAIEAGGTTGAALAISGNANLNPVFTLTASASTGGSASLMCGVTTSHTNGTLVIDGAGTITGGSQVSAYGFYSTGAGPVTITGNAVANIAPGIVSNGGPIAITGNCTGSNTTNTGHGCNALNTGAITITGSIIAGDRAVGAAGKIVWTPTAPSDGVTGHYVSFDGAGTPVYAGKNTDDVAKALTTFYYIDPTDGSSDQGTASAGSGGGGAWGF
jgi:hypothetical protein